MRQIKKYGLAPRGLAIRKTGNYGRRDFKLTILLGVKTGDPLIQAGQLGSVSNPYVCGRVNPVVGTSTQAY
jgi:hypothetical protein